MDVLPFELVIVIACSDPIAFARLIKAIKCVYDYVCTPIGKKQFLSVCMQWRPNNTGIQTYSMITGNLHSFFDTPAFICPDGEYHWFQNGLPYRKIGPAVILADGSQFWYQNNNSPLCIDLCAKYQSASVQSYWLHRIDGPALISASGTQEWYQYGKLYRMDGPAIICANGDHTWLVNNEFHRDNGPAIDHVNGYQRWYCHGKLHRTDGPAATLANGTTEWYLHGKLHRTDGPAVTLKNGIQEWWIDGIYRTIPF